MPIALTEIVCQDRSKCNKSAGSRIDFAKACGSYDQSAHRQTMVFWQLKK